MGNGVSVTSQQVRDNNTGVIDSDITTYSITGSFITMEYSDNKTDGSGSLFLGYQGSSSATFIFGFEVSTKVGLSVSIP